MASKKSSLLVIGIIALIGIIVLISIFKGSKDSDLIEQKMLYYLKEKYDGEFTNIRLIEEKETNKVAELSCGTIFPNEFIKFYQVYSTKYDEEFIVVYDKSNGVKGNFLVASKSAYELFQDNLVTVCASRKVQEEIQRLFKNGGVYYTDFTFGNGVSSDSTAVTYEYNFKISRDFTIQDYNKMIELSQNKSLLNKLKGVIDADMHLNICIEFNNVEFYVEAAFDDPGYIRSNYNRAKIESEEFIEYMNEELL